MPAASLHVEAPRIDLLDFVSLFATHWDMCVESCDLWDQVSFGMNQFVVNVCFSWSAAPVFLTDK